jgi:hypothetical protein
LIVRPLAIGVLDRQILKHIPEDLVWKMDYDFQSDKNANF